SLFHVTSLIFLISIFIPQKEITLKNYFILSVILITFFFIINYLIGLNPYLQYKFEYYNEIQEKSEDINKSYMIGIVRRFMVVFLFVVNYKRMSFDKKILFYFNNYFFGFIIYLLTYLISPDFGVRFSVYFIVLEIILVAHLLYNSSKVSMNFIFLIFIFVGFYKIYTYSILEVYDYLFFFE
ncbi:hypothetical protein BWK58_14325, partial [Flavobacterium columnare]